MPIFINNQNDLSFAIAKTTLEDLRQIVLCKISNDHLPPYGGILLELVTAVNEIDRFREIENYDLDHCNRLLLPHMETLVSIATAISPALFAAVVMRKNRTDKHTSMMFNTNAYRAWARAESEHTSLAMNVADMLRYDTNAAGLILKNKRPSLLTECLETISKRRKIKLPFRIARAVTPPEGFRVATDAEIVDHIRGIREALAFVRKHEERHATLRNYESLKKAMQRFRENDDSQESKPDLYTAPEPKPLRTLLDDAINALQALTKALDGR